MRASLASLALTVVAIMAVGISTTPASSAPSGRNSEPRRIALLIGIADYKYFHLGGPPGQSDLRGPLNDLARMRTTLVSYGFTDSANVRVLANSEASRAGIAAGFTWARSRVRDSNDVVVIYFSGHGSQVADEDGDEARVTPGDLFDEALVPWDARDPRSPRDVVIDDSVGVWLGRMPTKRLTMIIDACFSGTGTRVFDEAISRGVIAPENSTSSANAESRRDAAQIETSFPVLTAAGPYETAVELPWPELGGRFAGVMTYNLTKLLDAAVGTGIRFDSLLPLLRRDMRARARHVAGLDGDSAARHSIVFGANQRSARRAFYTVAPQAGDYRINAGLVQGLPINTVLDVFAPDDAVMTGPAIATIVIDSVGDITSRARLVGSSRKAIRAGSRGVPSRMPPGLQAGRKLAVYVSNDAPDLHRIVRQIAFVELSDSLSADVRLARIGRGVEVTVDGDFMTPLGAQRAEAAGAARTGANAASVFPITQDGVCVALRRAFVARSLGGITNPKPASAVGLELRVVPAYGGVASLPATTIDTLYEGERYAIKATARGSKVAAQYISVSIVGLRGQPVEIFPEPDSALTPYSGVNQGSSTLLTASIGAPYGPERIVAYFGDFRYSLRPIVELVPGCTESATLPGEFRAGGERSSGWTSVERRILILPMRKP